MALFESDPEQGIPTKSLKNAKNKKTSLWLHLKPKRDGNAESDKKKKNLSFRSILTRLGIGNSRKIAKKC